MSSTGVAPAAALLAVPQPPALSLDTSPSSFAAEVPSTCIADLVPLAPSEAFGAAHLLLLQEVSNNVALHQEGWIRCLDRLDSLEKLQWFNVSPCRFWLCRILELAHFFMQFYRLRTVRKNAFPISRLWLVSPPCRPLFYKTKNGSVVVFGRNVAMKALKGNSSARRW